MTIGNEASSLDSLKGMSLISGQPVTLNSTLFLLDAWAGEVDMLPWITNLGWVDLISDTLSPLLLASARYCGHGGDTWQDIGPKRGPLGIRCIRQLLHPCKHVMEVVLHCIVFC